MNKLTVDQVSVLSEDYNLADGHAFRTWNQAEAAIIDKVADVFHRVDRRNQRAVESAYIDTFLQLSGQSRRDDYFEFFLCFTASTALEVVANYIRMRELSVALIEPCFDNLHDILFRHDIPLEAFDENMIVAEGEVLAEYLKKLACDAILLVSPNNPTGIRIPESNLARIADYCRVNDKILILDSCFRFYLPDDHAYDQYGLLADANVKSIVIEDTGKTWPTLELKAPFFGVSKQLAGAISDIYSDFLLTSLRFRWFS